VASDGARGVRRCSRKNERKARRRGVGHERTSVGSLRKRSAARGDTAECRRPSWRAQGLARGESPRATMMSRGARRARSTATARANRARGRDPQAPRPDPARPAARAAAGPQGRSRSGCPRPVPPRSAAVQRATRDTQAHLRFRAARCRGRTRRRNPRRPRPGVRTRVRRPRRRAGSRAGEGRSRGTRVGADGRREQRVVIIVAVPTRGAIRRAAYHGVPASRAGGRVAARQVADLFAEAVPDEDGVFGPPCSPRRARSGAPYPGRRPCLCRCGGRPRGFGPGRKWGRAATCAAFAPASLASMGPRSRRRT